MLTVLIEKAASRKSFTKEQSRVRDTVVVKSVSIMLDFY